MGNMIINNELKLEYPDGFHEMTREEIAGYNSADEPPKWGLRDPERHIIITGSWKTVNSFSAMLVSASDMTKKADQMYGKVMRQFGYRSEGFYSEQYDGHVFEGLKYDYDVQGVGMSGEMMTVKHGKTYYFFYYYTRTATKEESRRVLEEVLDSVSFR